MIAAINQSWGWKGFEATENIQTNPFGNIVFKTKSGSFWRICPEELSCEKIAETDLELGKVLTEPSFLEDWLMSPIVKLAKSKFGELSEDERFCLKMPGVLGGIYEPSNLGKVKFAELIEFSGNLAFQIKDLPDGEAVEFVFEMSKSG